MVFKKFFAKKIVQYGKPSVPVGSCIYGVGDIHGKLDLLKSINTKIQNDIDRQDSQRNVVVYVGDYIDRGTDSKAVLDELINNPIRGAEIIHLRGNHEQTMLDYFDDIDVAASWFLWGGAATVRSYGVGEWNEHGKRLDNKQLHASFVEAVPQEHKKFLSNLKYYHEEGDYIFVHAGLRFGVELEKQSPEDMMSIRGDFVDSKKRFFNKTVVFGHTVQEIPLIEDGKIGIDTGAYATGRLTAVRLQDKNVGFIHT